MPRVGIATFSPWATSATLRLRSASCTADLTSTRARARNRWRLLRLLPFGLGRRSTMFIAVSAPGARLAGLVDAHVPLDQPAHLPLSVPARHHALQEVGVLFLGLRVFFGAETDHRQEVFDLREHPPLDHLAQFLVGLPRRVLAAMRGPRAQRELDDLVAEVLGIGDPGRLLDLRELLVEQLAVHHLPGVGVLVV